MQQDRSTSGTSGAGTLSRRRLLGATALAGSAAAVVTSAVTGAAPASAAVVLGERAPSGELGLRGTVVGRHRDVFRTFSLTNSHGVGVARVGDTNYMVTVNAGDGIDTLQVFNADTGALHFKASTPGKPAGNFVHDGKGNIYFSVDKILMVLSIPGRSVRQFGTVGPGILVAYEFHFDYRGRLWTGSYPAGRLVCIDPVTGQELARTPVLGSGNDYARGVSMSPDGRTVWAGTGTADPAVFRIDVDEPSAPVRVDLPGRRVPSMIMRTQARGRKLFVWHDDAAGKSTISVYDDVTRSWSACPTAIAGWSVSVPDAAGWVYANAKGSVVRMRPDDEVLSVETVATGVPSNTVHTALAGSTLYLVDEGPSVLRAGRFTAAGGTITPAAPVDYQVVPVPLVTQSLVIDPATDTAYAGAYRGDGLCSTSLATGEFAHSAPSAGIAQIEGMFVDSGKLYVGSYGSAVIVEHELAPGVQDPGAYRRLAKLGDSHLQSRIFAWAAATSHVVFGTVPEYGHRGGALGVVNRSSGAVHVYNNIIPELSIVGLTAEGNTVYGSTSCRAGYGIGDHPGDAVAFAFDTTTGKVVWQRVLSGTKELYGPVLLGGRLYVATLDTVVELRPGDGRPLRTFVLGSRSARPAWQSAELVAVPGSDRLAHLAGGTVTVLDPATGRSATVLTGAHRHIAFDSAGAMWVSTGNDIVKLRLDETVSASQVGGAIGAKYWAAGGLAGYGGPTSAERPLPGGAYQVFVRNGRATKVLWSPGTGAHAVKEYGAVGRAWIRAGYERGWGWPSTDERPVPGGVYQVFVRNGRATKVLWSPGTGAHAVKEYGAIGRAWVRAGYERGWGWPVTDEYAHGSEMRQRFSRGVTAHYRAGRTWTT
ncbi:hypothetical protein ACH9EU_05450 [Kocuria sp. M1R5S2]|uniref:hypothetical protein n=1 Tax=Kocuria rhizosphaerae TaxID=3376285 RepID=UPI0037BBCA3D